MKKYDPTPGSYVLRRWGTHRQQLELLRVLNRDNCHALWVETEGLYRLPERCTNSGWRYDTAWCAVFEPGHPDYDLVEAFHTSCVLGTPCREMVDHLVPRGIIHDD